MESYYNKKNEMKVAAQNNKTFGLKSKQDMHSAMIRVGGELKQRLNGFPGNRLLDICFAPGGFSLVFLNSNEKNISYEISLSNDESGLETNSDLAAKIKEGRFKPEYQDITLLANEYGEAALALSKNDKLKRA